MPVAQEPGQFEAMLLAMEARLGAKIKRAATAAQEAVRVAKATHDNLEQLEERVTVSEKGLKNAIQETLWRESIRGSGKWWIASCVQRVSTQN